MNRLKKLTIPALLLAGVAMSPMVLAQGSFDGHNVNVKFELWNSDDVSSILGVTNEKDVAASDMIYPDEQDFYVFTESVDTFNWDIDFDQQMIELTYTSIEVQDFDHQYMYTGSQGFHFQDSDGTLPDIVNVTVDTSFAPFGLDPQLVTFDANNIYVNLKGSMCHIAGMGSMPNCANPDSPTGYDNQIKLHVEFAESDIDEAALDKLYDWAEIEFSDYLTSHQESFYLFEFYVRHYTSDADEIGIYVGARDGELYLYDLQLGGLVELGELGPWLELVPMHMHEGDCPEGQHMMPDGMCMDNSAM